MKDRFLFDGGMGTMLQKYGMEEGYCPELMNLEHPDIVIKIHREYVKAGCDILTTNTFGGTECKLADYKLEDRVYEINKVAATLAREAFLLEGKKGLVAGSMGPLGEFLEPMGDLKFDDAYKNFYDQAMALIDGGVDFLIIETIIDIQELRCALLAAYDARANSEKSKENLKIIAHMAYTEDGRSITGTTPKEMAILCTKMGADIIGANCSLGPKQLIEVVRILRENTHLPISVEPNAGMPELVDGVTIFPMTPQDMAFYVEDLVKNGATYIGGCCGTTPDHIEKMRIELDKVTLPEAKEKTLKWQITSRSKTIEFGQGKKPVIIGERINPTGRKILAEEIKKGSMLEVKKDAIEQVENGADILDVNMGVPNIDEGAMMEKAIKELSMLVDVPLCIDSINPKALEKGLKVYPGRAIVNSVNCEKEKMESIFPLVKRYGAMVICLPISDGYLPYTTLERIKLVEEIIYHGKKYGLSDDDFILDPLVMTMASGNSAGFETLKTLRLYKEKFNYPTVMGLSNISFGLPNRPFMNSQFLTMALASGLTNPILNPLDKRVMYAFMASKTLLGFDEGSKNYIDYSMNVNIEVSTEKNNPLVTNNKTETIAEDDFIGQIRLGVKKGEKELVASLTTKALNEGVMPLDITDKSLSKAMEEIGKDFGSGKVFLPQVMLSAEAMQKSFQIIKEKFPQSKELSKGKIILATVKGDIHDLGKNIVAALLENNGYEIIDLGKDVKAEDVVSAIKERKPILVGLASLMTTTLNQIDITIEAIKKAKLDVPIIVGGAVVTLEYAQKAGATLYAKDAIMAVDLVNRLIYKKEG